MDAKTANRIPLTDILAKLGHHPARQDGEELWYCSPFRQEEVPSFRVNTRYNRYKDWGKGDVREHSVIDFIIALHNLRENDVYGALTELEHLMGSAISNTPPIRPHPESNRTQKPRGITVEQVQPLKHPRLLDYLRRERCLTDQHILSIYLQEVYFINHRVGTKLFYAIGFRTDAGGYELRNAQYKGAAAPKGITTIPGTNTHQVTLFEGWTDFLSYLHHTGQCTPETDCIILNGLKQVVQVIEAIQARGSACTDLTVYPHHDPDGAQLVTTLRDALPDIRITDMGGFYASHNDYNAWWLTQCKSRQLERG